MTIHRTDIHSVGKKIYLILTAGRLVGKEERKRKVKTVSIYRDDKCHVISRVMCSLRRRRKKEGKAEFGLCNYISSKTGSRMNNEI